MSIQKEVKKDLMSSYGIHKTDTGSEYVQIAILTTRISNLTEHFKIHKKDNHGRRGLLAMVSRRKKLLSYLKEQKIEDYKEILKKLSLRGVK